MIFGQNEKNWKFVIIKIMSLRLVKELQSIENYNFEASLCNNIPEQSEQQAEKVGNFTIE